MPETDSTPSGFSRGHRWLTALNLVIAIAAALAILAMLNYLAQGHFKRYQLADYTSFKLSPQTLRVLKSLTNDVKITIFYQRDENDVYSMIRGLLAEYQNANPKHIHLDYLDYETSPGDAGALLGRLHLTGSGQKDFVAFESPGTGHSKICYGRDLSAYDYSDLLNGKSREVRRTGFLGEMYFTADVFAVSYPREMKTYFLAGHGEHDPGDPSGQRPKPAENGYSKLAAILKDEIDCDWQRLVLTETNSIPADCKLLIIASSRQSPGRLSSNELAQVQTYLDNNGRLLALLDDSEGLDTLLSNWGVVLSKNSVVDQDKRFQTQSQYVFLASPAMARDQPIHDIVKPLANEGLKILMVAPRAIGPSATASKAPGAPVITPLVSTSTNSMEVFVDHPRQFNSPLTLIAAIEKGAIAGRDSTRLVVAGDADFLDDQVIEDAANHYFADQTLNWLLQRNDLAIAGLGPRPVKDYKLILTESQSANLAWLFLAAMPGSVLFLGGVVWLRRRS